MEMVIGKLDVKVNVRETKLRLLNVFISAVKLAI